MTTKKKKPMSANQAQEPALEKKPESKYDLRGSSALGKEKLLELVLQSKKFGGSQNAALLERATAFKIKKIPTGVFQLDWLTHGGVPMDRITRFAGKRNSGKTTLMLKVLANSQSWCRFCREPIVVSPDTGEKNCKCPSPRYTLVEKDKLWLSHITYEEAMALQAGELPATAQQDTDGFYIQGPGGKVRICETYRCAPMQCLFVETEHKLDLAWAKQNGVDSSLVYAVGSDWAEKTIAEAEIALYSGQIDLVCIDTITALIGEDAIKKSADQAPRIASRANIIKRFLEKIIAAQYRNGLMSETAITILINSQVRTCGIGGFKTYVGTSDGNYMDHLVALDVFLYAKGYQWDHPEHASYGNYMFTVLRNHAGGSSEVSGNFKLWVDPKGPYRIGDTDDVAQVIDYGRKLDIIKGSTGRYFFETPYAKSGQIRVKTLEDLEKFFFESPTIYLDVRQQVLAGVLDIRTNKLNKKQRKAKKEKYDAESEYVDSAVSDSADNRTIDEITKGLEDGE